IDAEVLIKIKESITGNNSDYWHYEYNLNQVSGGLWKLDVGYQCAVNKTGTADDYCTAITYPDGSKDVGATASHSTEIHDLAIGNTANNQTTGFFGTHSAPPPSGSKQVVKYAQLYETAFFQQYNVYDHASIRTFDVCVPNKASFSGVTRIRKSELDALTEKVARDSYGRYLKRITLKKIRGFEDRSVRFDFPVTAIVGPNGHGKTTVLGAAALIYKDIKPRRFFAKSGKYDATMRSAVA
ncbi:MAG TPA: ATP-binding protein, partial [Thermomicrobiales bacterium]|nr:ATP-binding protein [Thermomicrobiales bacterium]